jgi:signal transduction histidine kinase
MGAGASAIAMAGRRESAPVVTNPAKFKVVLKNLISNAVKFTPQDCIIVQALHQGDGIEVCITDTGIGIPPHALALIFEPFRQVETDGWSMQRGTELGLYIVKRLLVDLLNETVEVESEVGKGSTFRVWLPPAATRRPLERCSGPARLSVPPAVVPIGYLSAGRKCVVLSV